jgi:hypothetical protein
VEDQWLNRIALEQLLAMLSPADRDLIILVDKLDLETAYAGPWPPTQAEIGRWIGATYGTEPLTESGVRYRRLQIIAMWRGERGPLRQSRRDRP